MVNLKLTLDTRRIKADGTYPLVFKIASKGESRLIKTGFTCKLIEFNPKNNQIRDNHPSHEIINSRLNELNLKYLAKIIEYEKIESVQDLQELKEYLISMPKREHTVYSFWEEEVEQLYKANRNGGAQVYKEALIAVHKVKSLDIPFQKLDYNFIKYVETEFLSRGVKLNTIGVHYRALRAIYNKAINSKLVGYEHYPFRAYKIRKEATIPRTISIVEMRRYFNLNLDKSSNLYNSWLLGKLMFMLMGINFVDMVLLTVESIKGDRLLYRRSKTKTLYSIKLIPDALEIINYFKRADSRTLLSRLTDAELDNKQRFTLIIRQRNKVFNNHLKKLGAMIDLTEKLTGYVYRYSWSNIAKQLGYSRDMIAEGLGHQYGSKITGIYLECYDLGLIDQMNLAVYDAVTK